MHLGERSGETGQKKQQSEETVTKGLKGWLSLPFDHK